MNGTQPMMTSVMDTRLPRGATPAAHTGSVPPAEDAACVAALREAGAVILGKTVTTEFANRDPGPTSHPLNRLQRRVGRRAAPLRQSPTAWCRWRWRARPRLDDSPAAYCGIYGFKPTFGLLSLAGMGALFERFDTLGLYARGVADLALLRDALLGVDAAGIGPIAGGPPRVRLCRTPLWDEAQPESQAAVERAAEAFAAANATAEELSLPSEFDTLRTGCSPAEGVPAPNPENDTRGPPVWTVPPRTRRWRDTLGGGAIDEGIRPMPMSLDHLKVLDLTSHLSGPYCAMVLADHAPTWSRSNTPTVGTTCEERRRSWEARVRRSCFGTETSARWRST